MRPPLTSCSVRTPFLHENSDVNVTIGSIISPHATAEKIDLLKTRCRFTPLGEDLSEFAQFVHLQRIHRKPILQENFGKIPEYQFPPHAPPKPREPACPAGTSRSARRWLAKCGALRQGLALPRPDYPDCLPHRPGLARLPQLSQLGIAPPRRALVWCVRFPPLTQPRPSLSNATPGGWGLTDPGPACPSSSPTARPARSRRRHRARSGSAEALSPVLLICAMFLQGHDISRHVGKLIVGEVWIRHAPFPRHQR